MGRWLAKGLAFVGAVLVAFASMALHPVPATGFGEALGALAIGRVLTWLAGRLIKSHAIVHSAAFFGVAVVVALIAEMPLDKAFPLYGASALVWLLWDWFPAPVRWRCSKCASDQDGAFCDRCGAAKGKSVAAGVCRACMRKNRRDARCCAGCGAQLVTA